MVRMKNETLSLVKRAEEFLKKYPEAIKEITTEDVNKLVEDLHIHQIELEIQNEELRRAQSELEVYRTQLHAQLECILIKDTKGNIMPKNLVSKTIEQLLAEADELIQQIDSDAINDIEEEHRLQFERHAQNLKKIKSEVQGKIEKKGTSEISSSADGMHEAIQDIVKAMQGLKNYIF